MRFVVYCQKTEVTCTYRLVAYFVVFFKNGFSPSDLKRAQQATGALLNFRELWTACSIVFQCTSSKAPQILSIIEDKRSTMPNRLTH